MHWQKRIFLFHLRPNIFQEFPNFSLNPRIVVWSDTPVKISPCIFCVCLRNGVFLGLRPWSPVCFSVWRMVLVEAMIPDCATLAFRSLDVWCGVYLHQPLKTSVINYPPILTHVQGGCWQFIQLHYHITHRWNTDAKVFGDSSTPFVGFTLASYGF